MFAAILKWLLVLGLLASGVFFLLTGLGVQMPVVKYKGLEAYNIPAGVALLVAGIALARFWKVTYSETVEDTQTRTTADGSSTTTRKQTKITTTFRGPDV